MSAPTTRVHSIWFFNIWLVLIFMLFVMPRDCNKCHQHEDTNVEKVEK